MSTMCWLAIIVTKVTFLHSVLHHLAYFSTNHNSVNQPSLIILNWIFIWPKSSNFYGISMKRYNLTDLQLKFGVIDVKATLSTIWCYIVAELNHFDKNKNIERHTAHTIVSWPNPKQWIVVHTSDLMMIIRQSIYILSVITRGMGKVKTHSPTYCIMDNWENMLNGDSTLVQIMAWCQFGNKPLSKPMLTQSNTCMTFPSSGHDE